MDRLPDVNYDTINGVDHYHQDIDPLMHLSDDIVEETILYREGRPKAPIPSEETPYFDIFDTKISLPNKKSN